MTMVTGSLRDVINVNEELSLPSGNDAERGQSKNISNNLFHTWRFVRGIQTG